MTKSTNLKFDDVREVFRIIQDSIDLGNDPVAWRVRMLERMCKLIDAMWGLSLNVPTRYDEKNMKIQIFVLTPMPKKQKEMFTRYMRQGNMLGDPLSPEIQKRFHRPLVACRRDLLDDKTWYGSDHFKNHRMVMGMDDLIHSHDPFPQYGINSCIDFTRKIGDRRFGVREVNIVKLLQSELHHRWVNSKSESNSTKLTPRLSQLLVHLKGTKSEKQIARTLGLSSHTTHNYVKELYRRLGVSSRTELIYQDLTSSSAVLPRIY